MAKGRTVTYCLHSLQIPAYRQEKCKPSHSESSSAARAECHTIYTIVLLWLYHYQDLDSANETAIYLSLLQFQAVIKFVLGHCFFATGFTQAATATAKGRTLT
ncbi:hypothetical protein MRX96_043014 [Rhipicephalus microplus]